MRQPLGWSKYVCNKNGQEREFDVCVDRIFDGNRIVGYRFRVYPKGVYNVIGASLMHPLVDRTIGRERRLERLVVKAVRDEFYKATNGK
jgi:hypothetical protein